MKVKQLRPGQILSDLEVDRGTENLLLVLSTKKKEDDRIEVMCIDSYGSIEAMNEPFDYYLQAERTVESYLLSVKI